jgi:hypothetical protein
MTNLINLIAERNYVEADREIDSIIPLIMEKKIMELKKVTAAKMCEQMGIIGPTPSQKRHTGVLEAIDPADKSDLSVEKGTPSTPKNTTVINKNDMGGPGSTHYKNNLKEDEKEDDDDEKEELDEARINIIKARVRGGKIQRRKKVSNVPGMTLRGGQLKRMSAAERRRRKMGARKGKMKRRAKLSRSLMKRKRSLQRRKSLGL